MSKLLRFHDLVARKIVKNRTTLQRWIRDYGFPAGILIGPNSRAWSEEEIEAWLARRTAQGFKRPFRGTAARGNDSAQS